MPETPQQRTWQQRLWGDITLSQKITRLASLVVGVGAAMGVLTGWFIGCQLDFEDNLKNRQQDTVAKANTDSAMSLTEFRRKQKIFDKQVDSVLLTMKKKRNPIWIK